MNKRIIYCFAFLLCILFLSSCSDKASDNASFSEKPDSSIEEESLTLPYEYDEIIGNIINAYPWNNEESAIVPENPELSYMYRYNSDLSEIGFALIDLDNNGQKELIISDVNRPFIYDLYTTSGGKAIHLFDGGERYSYYLYENGYIENQLSGSAVTSGHDFYRLNGDSLEFIERIILDAYHSLETGLIDDISQADESNSFFRSESDKPEDYILITSDEATKAIETYQKASKPLEIDYTLLSEYKK